MPTARAVSPSVSIQGLRKSYDGVTAAVADVSLDVARAEWLSIIGPADAGKTSVIMMLAGFERPDAGSILLYGSDMTGVPPHRRDIGLVLEAPALFPHMSVAANIAFPLAMRRLHKAERDRRVSAALDMLRLAGLADFRPARLSLGQQQRVALARAVVFEPRLMLLDDPLSALDRPRRIEALQELRQLQRRLGMSVVLVTNDQAAVLGLSDSIAVLHQGRLRQVAAPRTLYEQPADAFVARFLSEHNHLSGEVGAIDDDLADIRLDCGAQVQARLVDARPGERCVLAIRPEQIAVVAADALTLRDGTLGESAVPAQLIEALYQGDHLLLRLSLGNDCELIVKRPAAAGLGALATSQGAAVAWQPYHALAFRPEA